MTLTNISMQRLSEVVPQLSALIQQQAQMMDAGGIDGQISQGLRTWAQQDQLFRQVPRVTDVPGGYSWHNFGMAVDWDIVLPDGTADWNPQHPVWQRLIAIGDSLGLTHVDIGTHSRTHRDWPHFQLTGRFPLEPDDEVRTLFRDGGLAAVWEEAFRNAS
jgi:peptidoglycan L-alanyl-D-glutamate endopeptidase CwlK